MNRVLLYLGRFTLILAGYAVASFAASAFVNLLMFGSFGLAPEEMAGAFASSKFTIPFVALLVAYLAFIPSIVVIVAAEVLGRRDWLYYALAGGLVALVMLVVVFGFYPDADDKEPVLHAWLGATLVGAGFVGGVAYWLVAGRSAGSWRPAPGRELPSP